MAWKFSSEEAEKALSSRDDFVLALHRQADFPVDDFVAKLIFTELVANVVRHAPGPIRIALDFDGNEHRLHVFDRGPAFEWRDSLPQDPYREGGRGLFLVSLYAREVVVERLPIGGNVVRVKFGHGVTEAPVAHEPSAA